MADNPIGGRREDEHCIELTQTSSLQWAAFVASGKCLRHSRNLFVGAPLKLLISFYMKCFLLRLNCIQKEADNVLFSAIAPACNIAILVPITLILIFKKWFLIHLPAHIFLSLSHHESSLPRDEERSVFLERGNVM